jgi:TonB family protein
MPRRLPLRGRTAILLAGLLLSFAQPAAAQTGTVVKLRKGGRARVSWDTRVPAGRVGFVLEGEQVRGIVRVVSEKKTYGDVEMVGSPWWRGLRPGQEIQMLEEPSPVLREARGCYLVWTDREGHVLELDGEAIDRTPAFVVLEPGRHQVVAKLPSGQRLGVRIDAHPGEEGIVHLRGRIGGGETLEESRSVDRPPVLDREEKSPFLRWFEERGESRIYHPGGAIELGKPVRKDPPRYPAAAHAEKRQGRVVLEGVLGPDGRFLDLRVVDAPYPDLGSAGLEAARGWVYAPSLLDGRPVPLLVMTVLDFTLR